MSSDCPNAIDYLILENFPGRNITSESFNNMRFKSSTHKKNLATRSFKA